MNWAIVYLAGILVFCAIYWYISGRKNYTGPLDEAQVESDGVVLDADRSSDEEAGRLEKDGRPIHEKDAHPTHEMDGRNY